MLYRDQQRLYRDQQQLILDKQLLVREVERFNRPQQRTMNKLITRRLARSGRIPPRLAERLWRPPTIAAVNLEMGGFPSAPTPFTLERFYPQQNRIRYNAQLIASKYRPLMSQPSSPNH